MITHHYVKIFTHYNKLSLIGLTHKIAIHYSLTPIHNSMDHDELELKKKKESHTARNNTPENKLPPQQIGSTALDEVLSLTTWSGAKPNEKSLIDL